MIIYENHCVECRSVGLRCLGDSCPNRHIAVTVCDSCGDYIDIDKPYKTDDGEELCERCYEEYLKEGEDNE